MYTRRYFVLFDMTYRYRGIFIKLIIVLTFLLSIGWLYYLDVFLIIQRT